MELKRGNIRLQNDKFLDPEETISNSPQFQVSQKTIFKSAFEKGMPFLNLNILAQGSICAVPEGVIYIFIFQHAKKI